MSIRTTFLALAVSCFAAGCVTEDSATEEAAGTVGEANATEEAAGTATELLGGSPWACKNVISGVSCVGKINLLPVNVDIKNVSVLDDADLDILNGSLNHLWLLSGNEINVSKILSDVELTVLEDFLNDFDLDITHNDINVCAVAVLGGLLCK
jgi:hypothetical protein